MSIDTTPPENLIAGEIGIIRQIELLPTEQSRCAQAIRGFSLHVLDPTLDGFGDSTTPAMVVAPIESPTRISDSKKYWGGRIKSKAAIAEVKKAIAEGKDLNTTKIPIGDEAVIEPLQTTFDGVEVATGSNKTVKVAYTKDVDPENISLVTTTEKQTTAALQRFGIGDHKGEHILLFSSQLPVVESWYNKPNDVTVVGCRGAQISPIQTF